MEPYNSENTGGYPHGGYPYNPAPETPAQDPAEQAAQSPSAPEAPAAPTAPATGSYWDSWQNATQNAAADSTPGGTAASWDSWQSTGQRAAGDSTDGTPGASSWSPAADNIPDGTAASWDSQSTYSADTTQGASSWDTTGAQNNSQGTGWGAAGSQSNGWDQWNHSAHGAQSEQATPPPPVSSGWEPYGNGWQNPASHQYVYTPAKNTAQPPKGERKKRRAPRVIAMLLACGVFGFGGGMLANQFNSTGTGGEPTVIYKAAEGNNTSADPEGNLSLSDVAAMAKASVVAIETENIVQDFNMGGQVVSGAGSGVIISEDGTIITNHHVVDGAQSVIVRMEDGSEYEAKVLGSDKRSDIAVLKINATGLTPAVIGDSDNLRVGEYCLAVGNPTGALEGTVTDGIISAVNRSVTIDGNGMTLLQMSAAVSPGNSGGGLFNTSGELIGIVNAKSDGDSVEGLGFAIPVNDAMAVAEELITSGVVTRPGLGVTIMDLTNERDAKSQGVEKPGVYINSVNEGSAAERAGLKAGDRVVSVEGSAVNSTDDLSNAIAAKKVGDKLSLVIERDGRELEITAILGVLEA